MFRLLSKEMLEPAGPFGPTAESRPVARSQAAPSNGALQAIFPVPPGPARCVAPSAALVVDPSVAEKLAKNQGFSMPRAQNSPVFPVDNSLHHCNLLDKPLFSSPRAVCP